MLLAYPDYRERDSLYIERDVYVFFAPVALLFYLYICIYIYIYIAVIPLAGPPEYTYTLEQSMYIVLMFFVCRVVGLLVEREPGRRSELCH
jgi:hypothetical protein